MQQILVILIFSGAVFYLARVIYKHLVSKPGCASGCGKCSTIDVNKIEEQFKANNSLSKIS